MVPIRQLLRHGERMRPTLTSFGRRFSTTPRVAAENNGSSSRPAQSNTVGNRSSSTPNQQRRPRPAKAIDARAFAASGSAGEQPRVIRSPRLRNVRGNSNAGKTKPVTKKAARKDRKQNTRKSERDDSEDLNAARIDQIEQEHLLKARPTPVRYEPRDIDFSTLQQTWPSLPSGVHARSSAVLEKLSSLSDRFPNGYVPPYELGRRLWKGKSVLFYSEAEKAEALQEVSRLARTRADSISQRKGDLVEPKKVEFSSVAQEDSKRLLETYVLGNYPR
ncbi:hypothetical protein N7470_009108 [Penicillium chermesinum]|nr:hypothetical protein N7470_009108 [Penicillium chermesinum]